MTAASWFLVMMTSMYGQQYLGPLSEPSCRMAAETLAIYGATCRQAYAARACAVPGQPGAGQACPVFDGIRTGATPR
jgi:hypothetical protein